MNFLHSHKDMIEVLVAGGGGFTFMITEADLVLKVLIGICTLGFILRKWYLMETKK